MAQMMEHVEYLSKEIGPRPAGTEEEQQAALYITEQLQKESGFAANMEEFSSSSNIGLVRAILALVVILVTVLAMIFPVLAIPALILAAIAAAVYALEAFDRPILSRFLARGASQNVVAKYQPNSEEESGRRARSRKIILVAHYDTDRVSPPLVERVESSGLPVGLICVAAMIVAAFLLLIRIFIAPSGGMGLIVLNVLAVLAIIVCLLPVVKTLLMRTAPYNEGANNNATGTAALIEVARRISRGSVSEADLAQEDNSGVRIHGEAAAREAGLIPEGVQIQYEAENLVPPSEIGEYDDNERLLSAKAAIAALTGQPVERRVYGSVAEKLVNSRADEQDYQPEGYHPEVEGQAEVAASGYDSSPAKKEEGEAEGFENAPSWFVSAQKNARKAEEENPSEPVQVQRSKYTEAFDHAERERAEREAGMLALQEADRAAKQRAREQEIRQALEASMQAKAAEQRDADSTIEMPPVVAADEPTVEYYDPITIIEEPAVVADEPVVANYAPVITDDEPTAMNQEPAVAINEPAVVADEPVVEPVSVTEQPEYVPEGVPQPAAPQAIELPPVEREEPASTEPQGLAANIPSIQVTDEPPAQPAPSRSGILRKLRNDVPSLSGLINPVGTSDSQRSDEQEEPALTRSGRHIANLSVPSVTEAPTPINVPSVEEPTPGKAPEQTPVQAPAHAPEPASSSLDSPTIAMSPVDYNMEVPLYDEPQEEKATQASSSVAVPRSRAGSLLDRLRSDRDEDLKDSPKEWLDIEGDFDARSVGKARGSWESFRDDQYFDDDAHDDFGVDDKRPRRRWEGGAASRASLGRVNMRSGYEEEADLPFTDIQSEPEDQVVAEEIEQIYHFRNPQFNTEIWFVAIGSDGEGHEGIKAFIEEHRDELRGSMIVEIESLGMGELAVASEEGGMRKVTASSRVKRFIRNATATTGISPTSVSLAGTDSISSVAQKAGFQSMHLFGEEGGRIALKGSADDVVENIDEMLLDEHVNFVFEMLKK